MTHSRPAYSLIFAFIIMTVMMIVAATTIQNTNDKIATYRDLDGGTQAYLAAQSAAEKGVLAIQDASPGYETSQSEAYCLDPDGDGNCNSWGDFIALAEGRAYGSYYYTPLFGTGTAGNADDCSVLDYIDPTTGEVIDSLSVDVDKPCNWNKLLYGSSATIPLFDTLNDGTGTVDTPDTLAGFAGWNLKIRTPCDDGTMDSDCERYTLNEDGSISGEGDTVVFWQLTGTDADGNAVSLVPDDTVIANRVSHVETRIDAGDLNTEVYESLINNALTTGYTVLSANSTGHYQTLLTECTLDLQSLSLQLNIVTPLKDDSGASIPYLEWQLETDSSAPLADNKTTMIGQGYFEGANHTYYSPYVVSRPTIGESANVYTLSN